MRPPASERRPVRPPASGLGPEGNLNLMLGWDLLVPVRQGEHSLRLAQGQQEDRHPKLERHRPTQGWQVDQVRAALT